MWCVYCTKIEEGCAMVEFFTEEEFNSLAGYVQTNDTIGYYNLLSSKGDAYADLALGVVENNTISGSIARDYALLIANEHNITIDWNHLSTKLMKADFALRKEQFIDYGNSNIELGVDDIQGYHNTVFTEFNLPTYAWTAEIPLNLTEDREALWDKMLDGLGLGAFLSFWDINVLVQSVASSERRTKLETGQDLVSDHDPISNPASYFVSRLFSYEVMTPDISEYFNKFWEHASSSVQVNTPMITQEHLNEMYDLFKQDPTTGEYIHDNRSAVYVKIFELTGSDLIVDAVKASTFSGFIGGVDEVLNNAVKYYLPDIYDFPIDEHSRQITKATLAAMQAKLDGPSGNAYLTDYELLKVWEGVWKSNGLEEFFPGKPLLAYESLLEGPSFSQMYDVFLNTVEGDSLGFVTSMFNMSSNIISESADNFFSYATAIDIASVALVKITDLFNIGFLDGHPIQATNLLDDIKSNPAYQLVETSYNDEKKISYIIDTSNNNKLVYAFDDAQEGRELIYNRTINLAKDVEEGGYIYIPFTKEVSYSTNRDGISLPSGYNYSKEGLLLQRIKDPITGELKFEKSDFPTYEPEADNPSYSFSQIDMTSGNHKTNLFIHTGEEGISDPSSLVTNIPLPKLKPSHVIIENDAGQHATYKVYDGDVKEALANWLSPDIEDQINSHFIESLGFGNGEEALPFSMVNIDDVVNIEGHDLKAITLMQIAQQSMSASTDFVEGLIVDIIADVESQFTSYKGSEALINNVVQRMIQGQEVDEVFEDIALNIAQDKAIDSLWELFEGDNILDFSEETYGVLDAQFVKTLLASFVLTAIQQGADAGIEDYAKAAGTAGFQYYVTQTEAGQELLADLVGAQSYGKMTFAQNAAGAGIVSAIISLGSSIIDGEGINVDTLKQAAAAGAIGATSYVITQGILYATGLATTTGAAAGTAAGGAAAAGGATAGAEAGASIGAAGGPVGVVIGVVVGVVLGKAVGSAFRPSIRHIHNETPSFGIQPKEDGSGNVVVGLREEGALLMAGEGADDIVGTDGEDNLIGNNLNNRIYGGAGNDYIMAGGGHDVVDAGDGDDRIELLSGSDFVDAGAGDDIIHTTNGSDKVIAGEGDDIVVGGTHQDTIDGGDGDDTIFGNKGNDLIVAGSGADMIDAGTDDDIVNGNSGDDIIDGGAGNDELIGDVGNDTIYGGEGNDRIFGGSGFDHIYGDDGYDIIKGDEGNDIIDGGQGSDLLYGGQDHDTLYGGADVDYIYGEFGNDILVGGGHDDVMSGGLGDDVYIVRRGDGADAIRHDDGGIDLIHAIDWNLADISIVKDNNDIILHAYEGSKDSVRLEDFLKPQEGELEHQVEYIAFAGEQVIDLKSITFDDQGTASYTTNRLSKVNTGSNSAASNPGITGASYYASMMLTNNLSKYAGYSLLHGSEYGTLTSPASSTSSSGGSIFSGIINVLAELAYQAQKHFVGNYTTLLDQTSWQTDNYHVGTGGFDEELYNQVTVKVTEHIKRNWYGRKTITYVYEDYFESYLEGTQGADRIVGMWWAEDIASLEGDDVIYGRGDSDTIDAGSGHDYVLGGHGDDVINGEEGNDNLSGDKGNDTISGGQGNDTLYGNDGNDNLTGGEGHDLIHGGDGNDTIDGGEGDDIIFTGHGSDTVHAGEGQDRILSGGTDTIYAGYGNDFIDTGDAADWVYAESGNDLIDASASSNNHIFGGAGHDVIYSNGKNNIIDGGDGFDLISYESATNGVEADLRGTIYNNRDRISNVEHIRGSYFDDGIYGNDDHNYLEGLEGIDRIHGYGGDDYIVGGAGGDGLYGHDGDDIIYGGDGDDNINGGAGNDRLYGGSGFDTIRGGAGDDKLYGGSQGGVLEGGDGNDLIYSGTGSDTLRGDAGEDIFRISKGAGITDVIEDFNLRHTGDIIDLRSFKNIMSFDQLVFEKDGNHTNILLPNDQILRVLRKTPDEFSETDFKFSQHLQNFEVTSYTAQQYHMEPKHIGLTNGNFLMYWKDSPYNTLRETFATLYSADGEVVKQGISFTHHYWSDTIVALDNGGFATFHKSSDHDGHGRYHHYMEFYDEAGNFQYDKNIDFDGYWQFRDTTTLKNGNLALLWQDGDYLNASVMNQHGDVLFNYEKIATIDHVAGYYPAFDHSEVEALEGGGFAVHWSAQYRDETQTYINEQGNEINYSPEDIFVMVFDGQARPVTTQPIQVLDKSHHQNQQSYDISALAGGGFATVYDAFDGTKIDIYDASYQHILHTVVDLSHLPSEYQSYADATSRITGLDEGGFVLTFSGYGVSEETEYRDGKLDKLEMQIDIFALYFNQEGEQVGKPIRLNDTGNSRYHHEIKHHTQQLENGDVLVSWYTKSLHGGVQSTATATLLEVDSFTSQPEDTILAQQDDIPEMPSPIELLLTDNVALHIDASHHQAVDEDEHGHWNFTDFSANDHVIYAHMLKYQPEFTEDTIGGLRAFSFDGEDDIVRINRSEHLASAPEHYEARSMALVLNTGDNITDRQIIYKEGSARDGVNVYIDGGKLYAAVFSLNKGWDISALSTNVTANQDIVLVMSLDGVNQTFTASVNGQIIGQTTHVGVLSKHGGTIGLGKERGATLFHDGEKYTDHAFDGLLGQMVITNAAWNEDEIKLIDSYLQHKWMDVEPNYIFPEPEYVPATFNFVDDLVLHIDASHESAIINSDEGRLNVNDLSGEDHIIYQHNTEHQPLLDASGIGGLTAFNFDGIDDLLKMKNSTQINVAPDGYEARSIALVINTGDNITDRQVVYEEGGKVNGINVYIEEGKLLVSAWGRTNDWAHSTLSTDITQNQDITLVMSLDGIAKTFTAVVDGQVIGQNTGVGILAGHSGVIGFGRENGKTLFPDKLQKTDTAFDGLLGEFILTNTVWDQDDMLSVDAYLQDKWMTDDDDITDNTTESNSNDYTLNLLGDIVLSVPDVTF